MKNKSNIILVVILVAFAALSRLVPHPFNFTPICAIGIFAAFTQRNSIAKYLLPLTAMLFSDILIEITQGNGFYSGIWVVYLSIVGVIGVSNLFSSKMSYANVLGSTLLGSVIFYLSTNFVFFYPEVSNGGFPSYTHNISGLMASYTAALPFFKNGLAGDLFYTGLLFSAYYLINASSFIRKIDKSI